ncbi:MAG TPA: hypothetical protein VFN48_10955 [Solirubrobacteraceae bacterium]|nr:hypothetical protein [Solirubrobacteraceae bacterium]
MSAAVTAPLTTPRGPGTPVAELEAVLATVAAGAGERDRAANGLDAALETLRRHGVLAANAVAGTWRPPAAAELALVRAVAAADSSLGRVLDGHLNAIERLAVQGPPELAGVELARAARGELRAGVWGGEPRPGEGEPATVHPGPVGERLSGVKTFCSGAGLLDRALVLARVEAGGPPILVWIDLHDTRRVEIDRSWYRSSGLRASASHRVIFHGAPVIARVGPPGGISAQPWFGRDALRTAASWAGMADAAVEAALDELADRPGRGGLEELAAGELLSARATITSWLDAVAPAMDDPARDLSAAALQGRVAIAAAARAILQIAARACGSHPFATGGDLDRVRRDLELFLLQHRLEPGVRRAGAAALAARRPAEAPC